MTPLRRLGPLLLALALLPGGACTPLSPAGAPSSQAPRLLPQGTLVHDTVDSPALAGNLLGDSQRRAVTVYLPPSYHRAPGRRFPVVYLLHGFDARDDWWTGERVALPAALDSLIAAGRMREAIVVMPDGFNAFGGAFWTDSPTTGGWGTFVARDLVGHVDRHFRTLPRAESRGLGGYSMGGFGALHLAARHPDVFGAVYALSACCMGGDLLRDPQMADTTWARTLALASREDAAAAGFFPRVLLAVGSAWTPAPARPPLYVELPFATAEDGRVGPVPPVHAAWLARSPEAFVQGNAGALRRLRGIGFDAGRLDGLVHIPATMRRLHAALDSAGIAHAYVEYDGTHGSDVPARIRTHLLPFLSRHLGNGRVVPPPRCGNTPCTPPPS